MFAYFVEKRWPSPAVHERAPLANSRLILLDKLGVPAERLADSDGGLKELSDI
jgi:hypothetical protein